MAGQHAPARVSFIEIAVRADPPSKMIKRPSSRDNYTLFPAGNNSTQSSITSERMGAFGTMPLEEERVVQMPRSIMTHNRTPSQPLAHNPYPDSNNTPILSSAGYAPVPRRENNYIAEPRKSPMMLDAEQQNPYHPTTLSNGGNRLLPLRDDGYNQQPITHSLGQIFTQQISADTTETRRKYDKLDEVYSQATDTVEFAKNFNDYLNERIPYGFTIGMLFMLIVVAFILTLVGALNLPFCPVQPMIPVWLMVSGILFIISAAFRIVRHIPDPPTRRAPSASRRKSKLSSSLCITGFELLFLFINLVWLILGAVWVYGSKYYVHFNDQLFEEHYCDYGLYYTAFWSVTGYLVFMCLLILALVGLLFMGSCKEAQGSQELN